MTSEDEPSWKKILLESVDQLYHFRDFFFEDHSSEEASKKDELVSQRLDQVLEIFESQQEEALRENKAGYLALRGRAFNVLPDFKPEALDCLSRAVKLNPKLVEAWNELGECYWKKGELQAAKTCFEGSLKQAPNKVGLRKLSMLLRQMGDSPEQNQVSLAKAREAVALDGTDGVSWYYLGNALLTHFFLSQQNPKVLQEALDVYDKALSDPATRCEPNVYYNRSVALKFKEQYQASLTNLDEACRWDPTWEAPKEEREGLLAYLSQVRGLVASKGHLKARKIQQLLKSLKLPAHLGPLVCLSQRPLAQLQPGKNAGVVVVGKVVASLPPQYSLAFTFGLVDSRDGPCLSLTVYNLATGRGFIIGDSVAIPDPTVEDICIKYDGQEYSFRTIRVTNPLSLVVNGRKLDPTSVALLQLHVTVTSE